MVELGTLLDRILFYIEQGGFIMYPLAISTFFLWYGLGYRYSVLQRGNRRSVRVLVERYRAGYARKPEGIIDEAVVRGIAIVQSCRPEDARDLLDEAFLPYEMRLKKFSVMVNTIVIVAPLMGLLGTVTGMIETFDSLADRSLFSQSGGIAGGIAQALFTTQMGLVVAIPGLVVGRILDRRARTIGRELFQIKDLLCGTEKRKDEPTGEKA